MGFEIDANCISCKLNTLETILHKFWECESGCETWTWVLTFLHKLQYPSHVVRQWKGLQMEHCLFNKIA